MARKPKNPAPENKQAPPPPETKEEALLAEVVDKDSQLRRLLKAEHNEWAGTISRQEFRNIADRIRAELNGDKEVEQELADD